MIQYPVILTWTILGLAIISFIVLIGTGNFLSFGIVVCLAALIAYLLNIFGVLKFNVTPSGFDMDFHENAAAPKDHSVDKPITHLETKEVFYIEGDDNCCNP